MHFAGHAYVGESVENPENNFAITLKLLSHCSTLVSIAACANSIFINLRRVRGSGQSTNLRG